MSLLGDIARIVAQGVGPGMQQNAQFGYERDKEAKQEENDNLKLDKQLERYDKQIASQEKLSKEGRDAQAAENQRQRDFETEQNRLNREAELARVKASRTGSNSDELRGLKFVDGKITDFDTQIGNLMKSHDSEMDPQKQQVIAGQIDVLRALRKNFITDPATISIMDSSGNYGRAYKSALFSDQQPVKQDVTNDNIPESLAVPPPRVSSKDGGGLGSGLLSKMQEAGVNQPQISQQDAQGQASDLSSYADRVRQGAPAVDKVDWGRLKTPQGGWRSPIRTKEVQYKNGQKGYTLELAD